MTFERPVGVYDSTSTQTNMDKYQTDSAQGNAASSAKVDGDLNYIIDALNTIDGYNAGGAYTDLATAISQVDVNQQSIASLTAGTVPDGSIDSAKLATDAVTQVKMADSSVGTAEIIDGNVTHAKLATNAVETDNILNGNVTLAKLATNSVDASKIVDLSVGTGELANNAVTTAKIANANVTTDKIADLNITTAKIADDAITADKLADTSVVAGSYTSADITVDAQGRVTSATNGGTATNPQQLVKAWAKATHTAFSDSYGFASFTRVSSTITRWTFASSRPSVNYSVSAMRWRNDAPVNYADSLMVGNMTTTSFEVFSINEGIHAGKMVIVSGD